MAEDRSRVPVDRGWAWMIVIGYFVSVFCMVGIAKSFGIILQELVSYFDIPVALGALVMGVCGGVYTLAAPICVTGAQHVTQRVVVVIGGIIGGIGICLSCFLFNIQYVIVTFGALYGIGNACIFGNGLVMIGHYFSKRRSLANGLALSGASLGQFALPPLLQLLLDTYALKGTLLIIGAMYFNVIACGLLYRPTAFYSQIHKQSQDAPERVELLDKRNGELSDQAKSFQSGDSSEADELNNPKVEVRKRLFADTENQSKGMESVLAGSVDSLHSAVVQSVAQSEMVGNSKENIGARCGAFCKNLLDFSVLRNYVVLLFVMVSFLCFFGHFNFILFMPLSASLKGVTKYEKAYLVSITGICDLCGRILIGFLGDSNIIPRYRLMALSCLVVGINIFLFTFANVFWWMAIHVGIYGFFGGCYVAINAPVLIDLVGMKHMPKVLGVVLFIQGLGAALGQPALGAIKDRLGSYDLVNYIESITMVAGSILLFTYPLFKKLQERDNQEPVKRVQQMEMTIS